jgi:hypothetical protein
MPAALQLLLTHQDYMKVSAHQQSVQSFLKTELGYVTANTTVNIVNVDVHVAVLSMLALSRCIPLGWLQPP